MQVAIDSYVCELEYHSEELRRTIFIVALGVAAADLTFAFRGPTGAVHNLLEILVVSGQSLDQLLERWSVDSE